MYETLLNAIGVKSFCIFAAFKVLTVDDYLPERHIAKW